MCIKPEYSGHRKQLHGSSLVGVYKKNPSLTISQIQVDVQKKVSAKNSSNFEPQLSQISYTQVVKALGRLGLTAKLPLLGPWARPQNSMDGICKEIYVQYMWQKD